MQCVVSRVHTLSVRRPAKIDGACMKKQKTTNSCMAALGWGGAPAEEPRTLFQQKFKNGCMALKVGMVEQACATHSSSSSSPKTPVSVMMAERELDLPNSTRFRLETVLRWLRPAPCMGLAELLLDNSVHQVSLCIASDAERLQFVDGYRALFAKQFIIASKVQAFWLARMCPDDVLMQEFACNGHVSSQNVRWNHQVEIYELCRKIVPQHVQGIDESEGQHLSTVQELEACADFVCTKCVDLLQRMDTNCTRHEPQPATRSASARPTTSLRRDFRQLHFDSDFFDF